MLSPFDQDRPASKWQSWGSKARAGPIQSSFLLLPRAASILGRWGRMDDWICWKLGWKVGSFSPPALPFPQHGQLLTLPIPNCLNPPHSPGPRSKPFLTSPSPAITVCLESASYLWASLPDPRFAFFGTPLLQPSHPPGGAESQGVMGANGQETRAAVIRAGQRPGGTHRPFLKPLGSLGRRAREDRAPHSGAGSHAGQGSTQRLEGLHGGLGDHPGGSPLGAATVELRGPSLRCPPNKG